MKKRAMRLWVGAVLGVAGATVAARAQEAKPTDAKADRNVAAYVGGEPITVAEVDQKALGTNMTLAQQLYDARRSALDQIVLERILAPKAQEAGVTVSEYIEKKVSEKSEPVTDEDVKKFYDSNQGRLGGRTLEQLSAQIRNYLANQQRTTARQEVIDEVMKDANVRVVLDVPRAEMAVAGGEPMLGPKDAEVTIVEYSDFQ